MILIRGDWAILALHLLAAPWLIAQDAPVHSIGRLQLHRAIDRELAPGQDDEYTVDVTAGRFVRLVARQMGVHVGVKIMDPRGKIIVDADRPNSALGPEAVSFIGETSGEYRGRVSNSLGSGGRYQIELLESRQPARADARRIEAERAEFLATRESQAGARETRLHSIELYQRAGSLWRRLQDAYEEALCSSAIGTVQNLLGENREALDSGGRALGLFRAIGDRSGEAIALNNLGFVYSALGEKQKALEYIDQALALFRAVGDRFGEVTALDYLGLAYFTLGEKRKALDDYGQALPLSRAFGNRSGEAMTLNLTGLVYSALGEKQKALDYYGQALSLHRAVGNRFGEANTLNNIGLAYDALGEKQKALDYYSQALLLHRAIGHKEGEASTLTNIGGVYYALGENRKALECFNQTLALFRAVGDRSGEATTLNLTGLIYYALGEKQKALDDYGKSFALFHAVGDRSGEAGDLNSVGLVYEDLGENRKALEYFDRTLAFFRAVSDRPGEAAALRNIGTVYSALGETQKALDYYGQALPVDRAVSDRFGEAATLDYISVIFQKSQPELGIFFAKQAVNILQTVRRDNRGLDKSLLKSFEKSLEGQYRYLAGLLVDRQRFGEAEEVLNLLKDKEAADFIRRDAVSEQLKPANLLDSERQALELYEQIQTRIVSEGVDLAALDAKSAMTPLSDAEQDQFKKLALDLEAANKVLRRYFDEEEKAFAASSAAAKSAHELIRDSGALQKTLRTLGPDVVAIYTLVLPDKYTALLITSGSRTAYSTAIQEAELNRKIFEFRDQLQLPASNPLPLAQQLYKILFPEGLRHDLDSIGAKTIMWSVDGAVRYVPIAALHDGKQYLVARFRNSLITPASLSRLTEVSPRVWKGVGFGASQGNDKFTALPGVPEELHRIFQQGETGDAPVAGRVEMDRDFTRATFEAAMRQPQKSVVHIATHFDSQPGVAANSQLLLGDGTVMTLEEIQDSPLLFNHVDLLTLSACSTAFTNRTEDGREVDSFGTIAQSLGANAVIASLWSVSDAATAELMESMYRFRQANPELGKGEALRQAQEQMANGVLNPQTADTMRGVKRSGGDDIATGWTHPYYWAPFILIGNWK
jgi:CHAT domain-containing protein/tetratricopeptide (TPR) repeat protein